MFISILLTTKTKHYPVRADDCQQRNNQPINIAIYNVADRKLINAKYPQ